MYQIDEAPLSITMDSAMREGDLKSEAEETADTPTTSDIALPAVLRGLDMSRVETRTDLIRELNRSLPLNEYNLPIYVYRPDLLSIEMLIGEQRAEAKKQLADMLSSSIKYLSYDMGYPTLADDLPFWSRLPWESQNGFAAFLLYIELDGARGLHKIDAFSADLLSEWYHQNCWNYRALAFDAFRTAHHARLREKRIFEVQDNQYLKAGKMLEKVSKHLETYNEEDMKAEGFSKMVASFEKLAKVQRESLGMGATGGVGKDGQPLVSTSVEVTMRRSAEHTSPTRKLDDSMIDMESLLSDPDALEAAQELIIKVNR